MISWIKCYLGRHKWKFIRYDSHGGTYLYECKRCGCHVEDEAYQ
jgi:hypothetical protein